MPKGTTTRSPNFKKIVPISTDPRLPRKTKTSPGVSTIPNKFATAVLITAAASFPLLFTVSTTADEMVVGRQHKISNPSNKYVDNEVTALRNDEIAMPNSGK